MATWTPKPVYSDIGNTKSFKQLIDQYAAQAAANDALGAGAGVTYDVETHHPLTPEIHGFIEHPNPFVSTSSITPPMMIPNLPPPKVKVGGAQHKAWKKLIQQQFLDKNPYWYLILYFSYNEEQEVWQLNARCIVDSHNEESVHGYIKDATQKAEKYGDKRIVLTYLLASECITISPKPEHHYFSFKDEPEKKLYLNSSEMPKELQNYLSKFTK